ncbi:MAG TPA: hypothetical protein VD926_11710, partial [Acidimicrobiales bacterium]|nr:hypothetical protein [Acidimicrobiales bacterium]
MRGGSRSVDVRLRDRGPVEPIDSSAFWTGTWAEAVERNGTHAAADAELLDLGPLTIQVDDEPWTLAVNDGTLEVRPGADGAPVAELDRQAFAELVVEERTGLGLVIAGRVGGEPAAQELLCAWDPVLRSALDGRHLHRPGGVEVRGPDGSPLDLDQRFRLDQRDDAARFLAEAGFLLLQDVFTDAELDAVDAELAAAVAAARPDDGASWWATTASGERYPCR